MILKLSYSHSNVKELFTTLNAELSHLNDWFCANKLSLNTDKSKYVLFHKTKSKDNFLWFSQIYFLILKSKEKTH